MVTASGNAGGNTMADAIKHLIGDSKVQLDEQGGNIIYTATVTAEEEVNRYLEQLRNGRPLIVLQMYIWEVELKKENSEGINWSEIKLADIPPGFAKLALDASSQFHDRRRSRQHQSRCRHRRPYQHQFAAQLPRDAGSRADHQ